MTDAPKPTTPAADQNKTIPTQPVTAAHPAPTSKPQPVTAPATK